MTSSCFSSISTLYLPVSFTTLLTKSLAPICTVNNKANSSFHMYKNKIRNKVETRYRHRFQHINTVQCVNWFLWRGVLLTPPSDVQHKRSIVILIFNINVRLCPSMFLSSLVTYIRGATLSSGTLGSVEDLRKVYTKARSLSTSARLMRQWRST